jgi:homoserine kinase
MAPQEFHVRVPATTSNLGPGFDAIGLAVGLANTVEARSSDAHGITIEGEGAESLPRDASNVVVQAFERGCRAVGIAPPVLAMHMRHEIPPARGLGSSAAAVVAGLALADAVSDGALGRERILDLATEIEGHPDNAAPAVFGGLQCAVLQDGRVHRVAVTMPSCPSVALYIPNFEMSTHKARAVLPSAYSRSDAVYNLSRATLLVAALAAGRTDVLGVATDDRWHQPARAQIFPALPSLIEAARNAGAFGAWLSGAGSTVAAFAEASRVGEVAEAMAARARELGVSGRARVTEVDVTGASWTRVK